MSNYQIPKIIRLKRSNTHDFSNARHTQLQLELYELVSEADKQKLNLPEALLKEWKRLIDLEVQITEEATGSVKTDRMLELDRQRDELLTNLFGVVRTQKTSPVALIKEAAKVLGKVVKPYSGLQSEAYDEEHAHVVGLLVDLDAHTDEVTLLGLTPVVTGLKTVNDEFAKLHKERRADETKSKLPAAIDVRPQSDQIVEVVFQYIQASYLLSTDSNDRQMMEELAAQLNNAMTDFKATHKASAALKKTAEEKRMEKMLRAFEQENSFAPGALKLTGKTAKGADGAKLYELKSTSGDTFWVKVEDGKLVKSELKGEKAI